MNRITYETRFGTLASGYVADFQESPLTGKLRILVCDTIRETNDPDAGHWIDSTQVIDDGQPAPNWTHNPAN